MFPADSIFGLGGMRLGPLTIVVMHSEIRGNRIFLTLSPKRIAWPGPTHARDAKFIP